MKPKQWSWSKSGGHEIHNHAIIYGDNAARIDNVYDYIEGAKQIVDKAEGR